MIKCIVVLKEKAKNIVNQGCKYIDLRSSYFMLLTFFQFLIQKIIKNFQIKNCPNDLKIQKMYKNCMICLNNTLIQTCKLVRKKIKYFIAYNLNDEVNAYTCYIKTIKQSNEFEGNKELLLIK